jgi:hypothetical protein
MYPKINLIITFSQKNLKKIGTLRTLTKNHKRKPKIG